jgi:CheY-like chemotaxis protein/Flp pilus assembly protein TadD
VLSGLRILVVDDDPGRADALAQELRARGATVAVTDVTGRGLERARTLDPEVVIVDAAGLEGPGFEVVRTLRRDPHLRWAQLLVASWDEIWPDRTGRPDVHRLAHRITPLVEQDAELRARALKVASFDTRLEITGPSRLLRALAAVPGPLHITVRNPKALVELDLAEGLVVGARAATLAGELEGKATIEGSTAIAALLVLSTGRVRVEKRDNPEIANMMTPVDEAVAEAALLDSPIPPSLPPAARERDGTERIEVGEGARPRAPEASPKPLARVAPVKKVIRTPPSKASSTAKPVPPPKPPALPPNPNTARKKTMLGVPSGSKPMAPPAPARITSAQQQVGTLRGIPSPPAPEPVEAALPSFDSAPTVAPPPHVSEELVEASKENGARAEGAGGPLKVDAMPGGAEDDVNEPTIPHHHAAREVDPTTKTEDASMIELADGPHPAGAPSAPASVEALADPTIETPPPHGPDAEGLGLPRLRPERSSEHPDRPPRGRSRVMLGGVVFLLLACAAAAAVMLVPDLRVRVFGPESIVTEPRTVAAAGAGAGPSVATPDDTEARTGAPAVAETAADDTAAEATAETETNADDTAAQATTTTDPDTDPDTEAATDTDTDTEAATAMESAALPPEVRALSPTALVSRGDAALREERLAEAEALYRLALEKDPRENHAMAGLAELFVTRGNGGQAVEWAERAVQLRRRRTAYRVILGDAYRIAGREDDARREYYTALRDEPRNPGALRGLTALRAE